MGDPTYVVTHDQISQMPLVVTEGELRHMLHELHADDPDAGWNITLDVKPDGIYAVGPDWFNGREVIAERYEREPVTLDTPLSQIGWDDADGIGNDLIDIGIAGDEWGLAWSRVVRAGGTVRDLRDDLYSHASGR